MLWQKKFIEIEVNFSKKAKALSKRLNDSELDQLFENLDKLTRHVSGRLKLANEKTPILGFSEAYQKQKDEAWNYSNEVQPKIEKIGHSIIQ